MVHDKSLAVNSNKTYIILCYAVEVFHVYFPFCHTKYQKEMYSRAELELIISTASSRTGLLKNLQAGGDEECSAMVWFGTTCVDLC